MTTCKHSIAGEKLHTIVLYREVKKVGIIVESIYDNRSCATLQLFHNLSSFWCVSPPKKKHLVKNNDKKIK